MAQNIPTVTDSAWAVGGKHRKDFGGSTVSHFCVFISGNGYSPTNVRTSCIQPSTTDFTGCKLRCFGYFGWLGTSSQCTSSEIKTATCTKAKPASHLIAANSTIIDKHDGMGRWKDDGQVDVWAYPRNCTELSSKLGQTCTYSGVSLKKPSFNPQGFTFTQAGSGTAGFLDGTSTQAQFDAPNDLAVDRNGVIYVADTMNNAIRMITTNNVVSTIAGRGPKVKGAKDGDCSVATFAEPKGLDVTIKTISNVETTVIIIADTANHRIRRIDMVRANGVTTSCKVRCLTGLCGNNSISATDYKNKASPYSGYADGNGLEARFSAPESVVIMNGFIAVADTGNFLIRWVYDNGTTITLAGRVISGLTDNEGRPLPGCQPPCMGGQAGFEDGNLTHAQFMNPVDVSKGPNNYTLYVADDHRVRMIELANVISTIYNVSSTGRVSTVAGNAQQGQDDGLGKEAKFFNPQGVFVTSDGIGYVVDQGSCRIRRISPLPLMASTISWDTTAVSLIRPSGCTSFDQPVDKSGYKVTRAEKSLQYNLGAPYQNDSNQGRYIKNCIGVPPHDLLQKHFLNVTRSAALVGLTVKGISNQVVAQSFTLRVNATSGKFQVGMIIAAATGSTGISAHTFISSMSGTTTFPLLTLSKSVTLARGDTILGFGDNLVVDDLRESTNEDSEQGMAVMVYCANTCRDLGNFIYSNSGSAVGTSANGQTPIKGFKLEGNHWYSEDSSVCVAAKHDGVLPNCQGYVRVHFQRYDYLTKERSVSTTPGPYELGKTASVACSSGTCYFKSTDMTSTTMRVFYLEKRSVSENVVHTVAGGPSAPLQGGCGFADAQPSTLAYFNKPSGLAAIPGRSLTDDLFMYVADTNNHRIRGVSVTCTQICENGGACSGPDTCTCSSGWSGDDCTVPTCSTACGDNSLCVGPNTCGCKPGYQGALCKQAQCVQTCYNGGTCYAPDTCSCATGWFDSNCTTPVCKDTCANGGNCTAPNRCNCPSEWSGSDCRIPLCEQTCKNGGYCVAPNTCACPPQWINHDCSAPVCTMGSFVSNSENGASKYKFSSSLLKAETYRPCDLQTWCNYTKEFECDQLSMTYDTIAVPSGPTNRNKTGRADRPFQCMNIELAPNYITPYELISADGSTTGVRRYSPLTPYLSDPRNTERGYTYATDGLTGPWTYSSDRQIANVAWYNISQGAYVCANGGNCTSPDVCQCAPGWMGFDCRTPICSQGYYNPAQTRYVSSEKVSNELQRFMIFMSNVTNSTALTGNYMNPNYTMAWEFYPDKDPTQIKRETRKHVGARYLSSTGKQGGYRCSIRAVTKWENESYVASHPNYYSRYMNLKTEIDGKSYSFWRGMLWPPLHHKSRILDVVMEPSIRDANFPCDPKFVSGTDTDQCFFDPEKLVGYKDPLRPGRMVRDYNLTLAYTNEGWRRLGEWNTTGIEWRHGMCIMGFFRNCTGGHSEIEVKARQKKMTDMRTNRYGVSVMDPDVSYRSRISYDNFRVRHQGRWTVVGGECIDQVIRGCYNNGTCVAPNTCQCAEGWEGYDCTKPICAQTCNHHGNCTFPDVCTCERGWEGNDCSIPICAQDCLNDGVCVAPDTCKCTQWPNAFRDGRLNGGRPLFQNPDGFPLNTGWTGFDCGTPICVQASNFYLNVAKKRQSALGTEIVKMGGHGGDNRQKCVDDQGDVQPRCPQYNVYVTGNEGITFQGGCGFDPYDTGCCVDSATYADRVDCYYCPFARRRETNNTFFCHGDYDKITEPSASNALNFFKNGGNLRMCGRYHNPRYHDPDKEPEDVGVVKYYTDFLYRKKYSNRNYLNEKTSNRFLCNVEKWIQGDYNDDAGLRSVDGVGSIFPLSNGRHVRINYANMIKNSKGLFEAGPIVRGEGVYGCRNLGSCVAPDVCSCQDGYDGYDCNTPLCRHLQPSGTVSSCNNGGICSKRDTCDCVQVPSVLHKLYPQSSAGLTGWSGSDCTIPMCVQGFYDPFCTDLPEAPAGEGCYRCSNGGNCTAPDVCTCAPGWSGFDCRTPLCHVVADPLTRTQLATIFEDKIISFESDPCGYEALYGVRGWQGTKYARGNCSAPNVCTCLCKDTYSPKDCKKTGKHCDGPWQDTLSQYRNVLTSRVKGAGFDGSWMFGSTDCAYGYEGNVNSMDQFVSCHMTIYQPNVLEKSTVQIIVGLVFSGFIVAVLYYFVMARLRQKFLLAKVRAPVIIISRLLPPSD